MAIGFGFIGLFILLAAVMGLVVMIWVIKALIGALNQPSSGAGSDDSARGTGKILVIVGCVLLFINPLIGLIVIAVGVSISGRHAKTISPSGEVVHVERRFSFLWFLVGVMLIAGPAMLAMAFYISPAHTGLSSGPYDIAISTSRRNSAVYIDQIPLPLTDNRFALHLRRGDIEVRPLSADAPQPHARLHHLTAANGSQFHFENGRLMISPAADIEMKKVELFLPPDVTLNLETDTGSIRMPEEVHAAAATLRAHNGDISLCDLRASGAVVLEAGNGDIDVVRIAGATDLRISSGNGDIHLSDCQGIGNSEVNANTGEIVIVNCATLAGLTVTTGTGDIHAMRVQSPRWTLDSAIGDIRLEQCGPGRLEVSSAQGDIELRDCQFERVDASTATGDLDTTNCRIPEGGVTFKTASGDWERH